MPSYLILFYLIFWCIASHFYHIIACYTALHYIRSYYIRLHFTLLYIILCSTLLYHINGTSTLGLEVCGASKCSLEMEQAHCNAKSCCVLPGDMQRVKDVQSSATQTASRSSLAYDRPNDHFCMSDRRHQDLDTRVKIHTSTSGKTCVCNHPCGHCIALRLTTRLTAALSGRQSNSHFSAVKSPGAHIAAEYLSEIFHQNTHFIVTCRQGCTQPSQVVAL